MSLDAVGAVGVWIFSHEIPFEVDCDVSLLKRINFVTLKYEYEH